MSAVKLFAGRVIRGVVILARLTQLDLRDIIAFAGVVLIGVGAGLAAAGACLFYLGVLHPVIAARLTPTKGSHDVA